MSYCQRDVCASLKGHYQPNVGATFPQGASRGRQPMKLGWRVKRSRVAYDGRFPVLEDDLVADLDGRETLYTHLGIHGRAVAVLAIDASRRALLVNEYRHPLGRVVTDLPAGSVHGDESPVEAARRELAEETGFAAAQMRHLGSVYPLPALAPIAIDIFLATDLQEVGAKLDATEILDVIWLPFAEVYEKVLNGEFQHGSLPFAVLLAVSKGLISAPTLREVAE